MTNTILLFTGETNWTQRAAHLAAATARETGAGVLILRPTPVDHLSDLGAGLNEALLSFAEFDALQALVNVVESYGVAVGVELYEYTRFSGGLLSAAEQTNAAAVFAPPPSGPFAALDGLRLWWLRRALRCPLYTLADSEEWAVVSGQTGEELRMTNYELRMKRAE